MTETGQISLTDGVYFLIYSVKYFLFYAYAFDDIMKFENPKY